MLNGSFDALVASLRSDLSPVPHPHDRIKELYRALQARERSAADVVVDIEEQLPRLPSDTWFHRRGFVHSKRRHGRALLHAALETEGRPAISYACRSAECADWVSGQYRKGPEHLGVEPPLTRAFVEVDRALAWIVLEAARAGYCGPDFGSNEWNVAHAYLRNHGVPPSARDAIEQGLMVASGHRKSRPEHLFQRLVPYL